MITPERITTWLKEPHQLQELSKSVLQQLKEAYPYFNIAQYLNYLSHYSDLEQIQEVLQPYPVNKVLLQQWVNSKLNPMLTEDKGVVVTIAEDIEGVDKLSDATEEVPLPIGDYFSQQGIEVPNDMPFINGLKTTVEKDEKDLLSDDEKSLMVVMSFSDWLSHISKKVAKEKEEAEAQKALKSMWQQQKLAALLNDDEDEIPEQVFEMAVNSITQTEEPVNETFANIYVKQGKVDKAIDIYKKLVLIYPEKSVYFAAKIENLQKEL